jgi:hypothetical protein
MSSTPKIAVITVASIGMVLTQSSSLLAEKQDRSEVTNIAAPIDLDEEVLYSALSDESDEVLEKAATMYAAAFSVTICAGCDKVQPVKRPPSSKSRTK